MPTPYARFPMLNISPLLSLFFMWLSVRQNPVVFSVQIRRPFLGRFSLHPWKPPLPLFFRPYCTASLIFGCRCHFFLGLQHFGRDRRTPTRVLFPLVNSGLEFIEAQRRSISSGETAGPDFTCSYQPGELCCCRKLRGSSATKRYSSTAWFAFWTPSVPLLDQPSCFFHQGVERIAFLSILSL